MKTYFSRIQSDRFLTNEAWTVIHDGMPICNDKATKGEAQAAADQMKVKPQAIWDGSAGRFWPLDTFN